MTSSTTAVAFLANALSDIRPIRAFGIYAAIIIPVNFLILVFMMPSIVVIHDHYLKEKCAYRKICCCCCKKPEDPVEGQATKPDKITQYFAGPHNRCVHKLRYFFIAGFAILGIVAAVIASGIGPLTK